MLGHKTCLSKFKKTEIFSGIFSDHNGIKLENFNRRKTGNLMKINWKTVTEGKLENSWKLSKTLSNNQCIKEEIEGEAGKHLETNINGNNHTKTYGMQQKLLGTH